MLDRFFKNKIFIYIYTPLLFLLACAVVILGEEINGTVIFAYIAAVTMVLSSRLTDAMLPAMLLCVFVTRCYNSADAFLAKVPIFVPVVIFIAAHFIIYRKKYFCNLRIGRSFFGICAVTFAVTLGGLGTISAEEYFSGGALYYVFGLGVGMCLFYVIVKNGFDAESGREVARIMYVVGIFACFCVLRFYAADWELFVGTKRLLDFQSSNNLSTFLMLAMPFPLFYASKRYFDILSVMLMYACIFLTGSRGGLLMGTVEFIAVLLIFAICDNRNLFNKILYTLIAFSFVIAAIKLLPDIARLYNIDINSGEAGATLLDYIASLSDFFVSEGEARVKLLDRMISDFGKNPVFGVGIGYTGNSDIYNPVKGAMNWYHMWFAQVVGGLGIAGIMAYGYQLVERLIIFFRNANLMNLTFMLSYMGLFLMSQVNPGEFCPMPYAALAVTFFIIMEKDSVFLLGKKSAPKKD